MSEENKKFAEDVHVEASEQNQNKESNHEVMNMEDMQKQLEEAQAKVSEYYDAWLRAKAEMENMRRRLEAEMENIKKFAVERFATELLAVKDSLEAALATENQTVEGFREGVEITLKQLANVFQHFGLQEISPEGEKFDPNVHQAIGMYATAEKEANTVHNVLQKGYLLNDRLLRPALVTVTSPLPKEESKNHSAS
jgi:molecular chaperone GrpE